ncbi:hypothetical protein [Desulfovibrio sp.]|mgnify:CR=1 FL=1|uniref:hypothetical protein n=1 Tax=Desulfovibrio sp. TaxID=885 RepID=UPI0025C391CF|nr:hypothetical protein [Desulfovibrio sp.]
MPLKTRPSVSSRAGQWAVPPVLLSVFLFCCLACCLAACTSQKHAARPASGATAAQAASNGLPRADPGYLQWLERQSMLGAAPELTAQVSGTERIWRNSSTARRLPVLLGAAPNWFALNPYAVSTGRPVFRALAGGAGAGFPDALPQAGLNGLFVSPTGERGDIWNKHNQPSPGGENVASLRFDPALGSDADFEKLAQRLEPLQIQLGGELPPAATGLGPDFILQARRAARFDGIYAMIAVPRKDWDLLPRLPDEWECLPLRPEAVAQLARRGLLPDALVRDSLPWATPGGWAATGEVRGADGQIRRWVYRYSGDALRPVLLWQDPSGQARRIFSAAIIRHTGLQQQTLTGLRLEALMGLDVPAGAAEDAAAAQAARFARLTPGLDALDEAAREVHRYGGWAMQDDVLPPSLTPVVLAGAVDFSRDSITPAAAAYALLSGDAAPLAALLRASQASGVDQSRLARGLHDWRAVDWRPLLDLPQGRELIRKAQRLAGAPPEAMRLWTTPASLAARALGLKPAEASASAADGNGKNAALREACLLLLGWRVGLPGLSFVSPQDLSGALDLPRSTADLPASLGLTPLWGDNPGNVGQSGTPAAPSAFGALEQQWADRQSFLHSMARLLRARRDAGLAEGKLLAVFSGPPGCVAVLSALPSGGCWLLAANFSAEKRIFPLTLPSGIAARAARDIGGGQDLSSALTRNGHGLELELDGRHSRHVLLDGPAAGLGR